jgi:hypothetical protein
LNKQCSLTIFFFLLCFLLTACTLAPPQATPTLSPSATASPSSTSTPVPPSSTPSQTATITITPTASDTPTPLPEMRLAPMTIMLHRPSSSFDSITFLQDFIGIIQEEELQVVTYEDLSEQPDLTALQHNQLMIITIDDVYLQYPLDKPMLQMIDLLKQAGYPAVLGVITEGDYQDPDTSATLQQLSELGWEIASHSDTHRNLLDVQDVSPKAIYPEIKASLDKIETAVGVRPITLVLPFGQMTYGDEQIKRSEVQWVIGINGGNEFKMSAAYYYIGRTGPAGSAQDTYNNMKIRFGIEEEGENEED